MPALLLPTGGRPFSARAEIRNVKAEQKPLFPNLRPPPLEKELRWGEGGWLVTDEACGWEMQSENVPPTLGIQNVVVLDHVWVKYKKRLAEARESLTSSLNVLFLSRTGETPALRSDSRNNGGGNATGSGFIT